MTPSLSLSLLAAMLLATTASFAGTYEQTPTGVVVRPDTGSVKELRLNAITEAIIQVIGVDDPARPQLESLMAVAKPSGRFTVKAGADTVTLDAGKASAQVSLKDGRVTFRDARGAVVLTTERADIQPIMVEGKSFVAPSVQFNRGTTEAFYGLGQHQNAQMDLNGEDIELRQHNMDIAIPFVVSDRNYGVLWDNNAVTRFGNPQRFGLASRDLTLTALDGSSGLTAKYYVDDQLILTRVEPDIRYQFLSDVSKHWPADAALSKAATRGKKVKVVWEGTAASDKPGLHKMRLFASDYVTLKVDGKTVFDHGIWRMNWNGWYNNFEQPFSKGKPVSLHVEWRPTSGLISLHHSDPEPAADKHSLRFASEAGTGLNYYFIGADSMQGVIRGYHHVTGVPPLSPKWAYGFWQSRQRYRTQAELLGVLKTYRANRWPIDNIVQDWFYWPQDQWGSHGFDAARFPDPKGMVDEVHRQNARIMISIWGKFYPNTANYQELDAKGHMWRRNVELGMKDWVGPGYLNSHFSPYSQEARDIFYRQMKKPLVNLGFDAWWMDNTEPDVRSNASPEELAELITPTQMGPGALVTNAYATMATQAVHDGLKRDRPDLRHFILTRSGFGGVQRNAAALWSGDIVGTWDNLHKQISAGVQTGFSGVPNWTHDIGGYSQEARFQDKSVAGLQENRVAGGERTAEDLKEWQELNQRWWQFGAFSPLMRSHGEGVKREIHEISPEGSAMRANLVWFLELRYRLMPYIYTAAADSHYEGAPIMRGLALDFPADARAKRIADQYLFGTSMLVAPVTRYGATSRSVYFPGSSTWFNAWTGETVKGGETHTVAAPLDQMPLFVKAGAIVPMGPVTQYVDEKPDAPLSVLVYTGADGSYSLYEDDGVSNSYKAGRYTRIPFAYDDKRGEVTIGPRTGSYAGMVTKRTFNVRFLKPGDRTVDFDAPAVAVSYSGDRIVVKAP
ncbi:MULTISPECIES: TIM-barrel domain-containing protein [unclassified Roseateles]|uniref:TIM-barrel domain-containing protein n=1 Tax=unclassified Roseateles TaxID=2626991 RepID=UPI0006FD7E70|nr:MULTISPECIES: TIM-barrel domain-containing protein [unclassified Roseateles]KQW46256.1 alpha-xylosidase [Pelomonas sp. Root405]KRA73305.1 alpha-xylosidase [Pelomonas sp. Root662]